MIKGHFKIKPILLLKARKRQTLTSHVAVRKLTVFMIEQMDLSEASIGLDGILIVSSMVANIGQTIHCYQTIVEVYQAL